MNEVWIVSSPGEEWPWLHPMHDPSVEDRRSPFTVPVVELEGVLGVPVGRILAERSVGSGLMGRPGQTGYVSFRSLRHLVRVCELLFHGRDSDAHRELTAPSSTEGTFRLSRDLAERRLQCCRLFVWRELQWVVAEHGYYWLLSDRRHGVHAERLLGSGNRAVHLICIGRLCASCARHSGYDVEPGGTQYGDGSVQEGEEPREELMARLRVERMLERVRGRLDSERRGVTTEDRFLPATCAIVEQGGLRFQLSGLT